MVIKVGVISILTDDKEKFTVRSNNIEAINKVGGVAIPITYINMEDQLDLVDKILLPGGDFKNPDDNYIGDFKPPYTSSLDCYNAYIIAIEYALRKNKPILAICAGMQSLNVALGGNLNPKIDNHRLEDQPKIAHSVAVNKESKLYEIVGKESIKVNSEHSQALFDLAEGTIVSAISEDGIVEAIEYKDKPIIAVQWHPEGLMDEESEGYDHSYKIFDYFVNKL